MNFLSTYKEQLYAVMRIVVGLLFLSHGIQKAGMISGLPTYDGFFLLAMIIEISAGVMVTIGWQARWAAFIASGEMAVAYFKVHFSRGTFPIVNGGELAVFYCFVFLFIAAYGAGIWSIDNASKKTLNF